MRFLTSHTHTLGMTMCSFLDQGESLLGDILLSRSFKKAAPSPGSDRSFRLAAACLPGYLNATFFPGFTVLSADRLAPGRRPRLFSFPSSCFSPSPLSGSPFRLVFLVGNTDQ